MAYLLLAIQANPQTSRPFLKCSLAPFKDIADSPTYRLIFEAARCVCNRWQFPLGMRTGFGDDNLIGVGIDH
jgi:hypothetical protein